MTEHFATSPDLIKIEHDHAGRRLPRAIAKTWKTLEQACHLAGEALSEQFAKCNPQAASSCLESTKLSHFGYFSAHSEEEKARSALSESLMPL